MQNTKYFQSAQSAGKTVFLLCGFGGRIYQTQRLVHVLLRAGYDVYALDFSKDSLASGDSDVLLELANEVSTYIEEKTKDLSSDKVLLIGISLGALLSLNVIRRSMRLKKAVLITGGDIVKIAQKLYPKKWTQSYKELAETWRQVNMYSDVENLKGKRFLFVLHPSSKMIDAQDAYAEIRRQTDAGNTLLLVERPKYDHTGTIIDETIIYPKRVLTYIKQLGEA